MNKLFILGWDNCLLTDVVENKIYPAYLAAWAVIDKTLAEKWTLEDSKGMQGKKPDQIWDEICAEYGQEKGLRAKKVFYDTYYSLPVPQLEKNALRLLQAIDKNGYYAIVVSNKSNEILAEEMVQLDRDAKISSYVNLLCGTSTEYCAFFDVEMPKCTDNCDAASISRQMKLKGVINFVQLGLNEEVEVTVIANAGYAEPAYRLMVERYEEASPEVFDWIAEELEAEFAMR